MLSINSSSSVHIEAPLRGVKRSGFGREQGMIALEHYTDLKTVFFGEQDGGRSALVRPRRPEFLHLGGDYPDYFAMLLPEVLWKTYAVNEGELPQSPSECDARHVGFLPLGL